MNINDLTIGEAREIAALMGGSPKQVEPTPFTVNEAYFIRTVTYHLVGRVVSVTGKFLVLNEASWIADSGRFSNAISNGELVEVEPVGSAIVNMQSITDAFPWNHPLPDTQK